MPKAIPIGIRQAAIQRATEIGISAAANETGIAKATLSGWCKAGGIRTVQTDKTRKRVEAARVKWEERRVELVHRMGEVADVLLAKALDAAHAGKLRDAQSGATAMAILVDKAQLLSGGATSRPVSMSGLDDELERLAAKVETNQPETVDA